MRCFENDKGVNGFISEESEGDGLMGLFEGMEGNVSRKWRGDRGMSLVGSRNESCDEGNEGNKGSEEVSKKKKVY